MHAVHEHVAVIIGPVGAIDLNWLVALVDYYRDFVVSALLSAGLASSGDYQYVITE